MSDNKENNYAFKTLNSKLDVFMSKFDALRSDLVAHESKMDVKLGDLKSDFVNLKSDIVALESKMDVKLNDIQADASSAKFFNFGLLIVIAGGVLLQLYLK